MKDEELMTLAQIGTAIWAEPEVAERTTAETLMAVSIQDPEPERALERAASVLLERASRQGTLTLTQQNFSQLGKPFYRLEHEKRFVLSALHLGRWSYDRVSRVMGLSREQVEELAWTARMELAALGVMGGVAGKPRGTVAAATYAGGSAAMSANCPEYDPRRPWTQRFLDEETTGGSERLFLQTHLMKCESCKNSLNRSREVYFSVEAMIPRLADDLGFAKSLGSVFEQARLLRFPTERPFLQSVGIFISRREVQLALAGLAALVVLKALS